jgi:hypothetical protein
MATHFSGPVVSTAGFQPGSSAKALTFILAGTIAIDPVSLNDGEQNDVSVTITGAATGDTVIMNPPAAGLDAGIALGGAWVSAANTVKVRIINYSGGVVNGASLSWNYVVLRYA